MEDTTERHRWIAHIYPARAVRFTNSVSDVFSFGAFEHAYLDRRRSALCENFLEQKRAFFGLLTGCYRALPESQQARKLIWALIAEWHSSARRTRPCRIRPRRKAAEAG